MLTIHDYDHAERIARCDLSYVEIQAFATSTFQMLGFPDRVVLEPELARYVDWNNASSNYQYFQKDHFVVGPSVYTRFSQAEAAIIQLVSDATAKLTHDHFQREMRPISTLMAQIGLFRIIMAARDRYGLANLRIFEVGPGNGYFGALMASAGLPYTGFDNAQSLYLWQNRLLSAVAGATFYDWAGKGPPAAPDAYPVQHLPWWDYARMHKGANLGADIVVSNANLCEMNVLALNYTIRMALQLFRDSEVGLIIFTSFGHAQQNQAQSVHEAFVQAGFRKICGHLFHAYLAPHCNPAFGFQQLDRDLPIYDPDRTGAQFDAIEVLKLTADNLPMDMDILRFLGVFSFDRLGEV